MREPKDCWKISDVKTEHKVVAEYLTQKMEVSQNRVQIFDNEIMAVRISMSEQTAQLVQVKRDVDQLKEQLEKITHVRSGRSNQTHLRDKRTIGIENRGLNSVNEVTVKKEIKTSSCKSVYSENEERPGGYSVPFQ